MPAARFADVVIRQTDTMEFLAATYLHDPRLWPELARINRLRYPYLSDDPRDLLGSILGRTTIRPVLRELGVDGFTGVPPTTGLLHGDRVIPLADDLIVREGQFALVLNVSSEGGPSWNARPILGAVHQAIDGPRYDPGVLSALTEGEVFLAPDPPYLVLQRPVSRTWPAGVEVTIHEDPHEQRSFVLTYGQTIRVPMAANSALLAGVRPDDYDDLMGIDIGVDPISGQILLNEHGDLALVSGIENLSQAIRHKLLTPVGDLPLHPGYGDPALDALGEIWPHTLSIVNAGVRQAVVSDPRVTGTPDSTAVHDGDLVTVDVTVELAGAGQLVTISTILPRGG